MLVLFSQVCSVILATIAISKSYVDFRARRESLQMFFLWTFTWTSIVIVAVFPSIIDFLIKTGAETGTGRVLGMALVFLFFLLYRVYVKLERLEQQITMLVQEIALGVKEKPSSR